MFFSLYTKYSLFFSESAIPTSLTFFLLSISILDSSFLQSPAQGGGEV